MRQGISEDKNKSLFLLLLIDLRDNTLFKIIITITMYSIMCAYVYFLCIYVLLNAYI